MFACHEGHAEVVKLLLAVSRINVNVQDKVSASFSHLASSYSYNFSHARNLWVVLSGW